MNHLVGIEDVSKISFDQSKLHNNNGGTPEIMSPIIPEERMNKQGNNFLNGRSIENNMTQLESEPKLRKKTTLKLVPEINRSIDKDASRHNLDSSPRQEYNKNSPSKIRGPALSLINPHNQGENNDNEKTKVNANIRTLANKIGRSPTPTSKKENTVSPKGQIKKGGLIESKSKNSDKRSSSINKKAPKKQITSGSKVDTGLSKSAMKGKSADRKTSEWEEAIENEKKKKEMFGNKSVIVPSDNRDKKPPAKKGTKNPIDKMISFPYDDNDSFVFESSDEEPKPVRGGNKQQEYANIRNSGGSGPRFEPHNQGNYSSAIGVLNPIEEESNITDSKTNLKNSSVPHKNMIIKSNVQNDQDPTRHRPPQSPKKNMNNLLNSNDIYDSEFIKLEKTLYESKTNSNAESNRMINENSKRTQNYTNRGGTNNSYSRDNSLNRVDLENRSVGKRSLSGKNGESGNRLAFVAGQNLISPNSVVSFSSIYY